MDNGYIFGDEKLHNTVNKIKRCGVRIKLDRDEVIRQEEAEAEIRESNREEMEDPSSPQTVGAQRDHTGTGDHDQD